MIAFFVIIVLGYLVSGSFDDVRAAGKLGTNVASTHAIVHQNPVQPFSVGSANVVQGTPTSFDFFATVKNPNTDWYATFTYVFTAGSLTTRTETGFVMPGMSASLLSLGVVASSRPSSPKITLSDVVWHRVDRHVAPTVSGWLADHGNFRITVPTYAADLAFASGKVGRTTFTVTNASPYSYWAPQFTVLLERAGAVVGVADATVAHFASGESRDVEVRWYGELPLTATATVAPSVNYFDPSSFMSPEGVPATDIRDTLR